MSTIIRKQVNAFNWIEVNDFSKIINRKKYDTLTANLLMWRYIDRYDSIYSNDDMDSSMAIFLFQKDNGEFFSYCVEFTSYNINGFYETYGAKIKPLSEDEAMDFVEKYGDGKDFEKIFGEVEE